MDVTKKHRSHLSHKGIMARGWHRPLSKRFIESILRRQNYETQS